MDIIPDSFDIRDLTDLEFMIFTRLRVGKENATSNNDFRDYLNNSLRFRNTDWRDVRKAMASLRLEHGLRICNMEDGRGFYIAANYQEYKEYRHKLINRAKALYRTVQSMDNKQPSQMELEI